MNRMLSRQHIPNSMIALGLLAALLLILLPPEKTLGDVVKAVFVHAALVETGLVVFGAAGIAGVIFLARPLPALAAWSEALQQTGVLIWLAYALSSMIATYMAWGVLIAWEEPRVQASIQIMGASIIFWLLSRWLRQPTFTAIVNIVMAAIAWGLTKFALNIRHPLDPIGTSDSPLFKGLFLLLFLIVLLMAVQLTRWQRRERATQTVTEPSRS